MSWNNQHVFLSCTQIYTRYGKCYTFNSGLDGNPLLTTLKGGTGNGLEIMLDIQQDEYLPVWGETGQCHGCHGNIYINSYISIHKGKTFSELSWIQYQVCTDYYHVLIKQGLLCINKSQHCLWVKSWISLWI